MGFLGALLGAAPTVLAGVAKGKRDREETEYTRDQAAMKQMAEENARQQIMAAQQFDRDTASRQRTEDVSYRTIRDTKADTQQALQNTAAAKAVEYGYGRDQKADKIKLDEFGNRITIANIMANSRKFNTGEDKVALRDQTRYKRFLPIVNQAEARYNAALSARKGENLSQTEIIALNTIMGKQGSAKGAMAAILSDKALSPEAKSMGTAALEVAEAFFGGKRVAWAAIEANWKASMIEPAYFQSNLQSIRISAGHPDDEDDLLEQRADEFMAEWNKNNPTKPPR